MNGKLEDNTDYAVFQRSFDKGGDYENEGFINFTTHKDHTGAIVAGVLVPLLIVAAVAAGIFFYRRRRTEDQNEEEGIELNKSHRRGTVSKLFRRSGIGKLSAVFGATLFPGSLFFLASLTCTEALLARHAIFPLQCLGEGERLRDALLDRHAIFPLQRRGKIA